MKTLQIIFLTIICIITLIAPTLILDYFKNEDTSHIGAIIFIGSLIVFSYSVSIMCVLVIRELRIR